MEGRWLSGYGAPTLNPTLRQDPRAISQWSQDPKGTVCALYLGASHTPLSGRPGSHGCVEQGCSALKLAWEHPSAGGRAVGRAGGTGSSCWSCFLSPHPGQQQLELLFLPKYILSKRRKPQKHWAPDFQQRCSKEMGITPPLNSGGEKTRGMADMGRMNDLGPAPKGHLLKAPRSGFLQPGPVTSKQ